MQHWDEMREWVKRVQSYTSDLHLYCSGLFTVNTE